MIPPIFAGQPVIIVAGGPSLLGFDFSRLLKNVIAINRAHEFLPAAQVLWWSDAIFWHWNKDKLLAHPAPWKATCQIEYRDDDLPEGIHQYRFTGLEGFDARAGCLRHGNNSAYAAMHLAVHLGARFLILLGLDMCHAGSRTHFHGGHGIPHKEETLTRLMIPYFQSLASPLAERGIRVLNASPDSALRVWPRCTIEQGLAAYDDFLSQGHF